MSKTFAKIFNLPDLGQVLAARIPNEKSGAPTISIWWNERGATPSRVTRMVTTYDPSPAGALQANLEFDNISERNISAIIGRADHVAG